ncbi:phage tail protein domain-containing protein [Geodermatophilus saharensis]|uniref:Phage tail protein domain-containing protein n=1 Tax=Geodermatophilus saharensis TaxID=1137994 RepID=A0A239C6S0_9ACTN|nr:phage tail protein [Geodermatophilus saharensis]SNS15124.1 phage tail protein domain-containing protein [Geodermatophilus saharensis]
MSATSSWLQHLPPVLWRDEPRDPDDPRGPGFSLGGMLRIFEKILTGIDDDAAVTRVTADGQVRGYGALTDEIARVPLLFDPWKTEARADADFLRWLAGWVALQFPTLQGEDLWDEYQRRKATAEIAGIHRLRGLRAGLNRYLELYATGATRPRIALDDGTAVLTVDTAPTGPVPVAALVTQGPVVVGTEVRAEGLARPTCIAAGADGSLFLGDAGTPAPAAVRRRLWRISATGAYDLAGRPPTPRPLQPNLLTANTEAVAVAVAPPRAGRPETLYVLDSTGKLSAVPDPFLDTAVITVATLDVAREPFQPVPMTVDRNEDLLVLDRGGGLGSAKPPRILAVNPASGTITPTVLTEVVHGLSLLVLPDGKLIIGDGREQAPTGAAQLAGNLVRVDRQPSPWRETVLLPADDRAANPLVAPTGLALGAGGQLHVLDAGLKPLSPKDLDDPFVLPVAQPAGLYRVDLSADPLVVRRVTEPGSFVYPTGMVAAGGRLAVCDPGHPDLPQFATSPPRVRPHRFNVVVHFTVSRLPGTPAEQEAVMRRIVGDVAAIVDREKPAHTHWDPIVATERN